MNMPTLHEASYGLDNDPSTIPFLKDTRRALHRSWFLEKLHDIYHDTPLEEEDDHLRGIEEQRTQQVEQARRLVPLGDFVRFPSVDSRDGETPDQRKERLLALL